MDKSSHHHLSRMHVTEPKMLFEHDDALLHNTRNTIKTKRYRDHLMTTRYSCYSDTHERFSQKGISLRSQFSVFIYTEVHFYSSSLNW